MIKGKIERKGVRLMLIWEENKEKSASKSKHKKSRGGHFGKGEEGEIFFLDQNQTPGLRKVQTVQDVFIYMKF